MASCLVTRVPQLMLLAEHGIRSDLILSDVASGGTPQPPLAASSNPVSG